ncbi:helix-turn-helix domain-containing protein [Paenibacillus aurantiacus]|uniref:Helix-turn-helix domain-containing protein n=1 Tax=Paenibacillus aurantiacus TaxID=1936118 RepID=A0ABV5KUC2_9BACL
MTPILKLVGSKIRDIRKQRGWSQELLGEKAGVKFSYIGSVERGEQNITLLNLEKIATALDVKVHSLFSYSVELEKFEISKESMIYELLEILIRLEQNDLRKVRAILKEFQN